MNSDMNNMDIGTLMYLEYLSKYNKDKLNEYEYFLPIELFDYYNIEIVHYDRDESRDYSSGFRRTVTKRYFTYLENKEYYEINIQNFNRWLDINHKIINEDLKITYNEYLKSLGSYKKTVKKEKIDDYDEIEYTIKTSYKFYNKEV